MSLRAYYTRTHSTLGKISSTEHCFVLSFCCFVIMSMPNVKCDAKNQISLFSYKYIVKLGSSHEYIFFRIKNRQLLA